MNIFAKNYENCIFPSGNMRVVQICTTPPKMGVSESPPKINSCGGEKMTRFTPNFQVRMENLYV